MRLLVPAYFRPAAALPDDPENDLAAATCSSPAYHQLARGGTRVLAVLDPDPAAHSPPGAAAACTPTPAAAALAVDADADAAREGGASDAPGQPPALRGALHGVSGCGRARGIGCAEAGARRREVAVCMRFLAQHGVEMLGWVGGWLGGWVGGWGGGGWVGGWLSRVAVAALRWSVE
jgi:hypothetical protein